MIHWRATYRLNYPVPPQSADSKSEFMSLKKKLLCVFTSLAGIVLILVINGFRPSESDDHQISPNTQRTVEPATLRATEYGPVVGSNEKNQTHVWLGIPYAKPPTGELRWREPQMTKIWSNEFEALSRRPECLHSRTIISFKSGRKQIFAGAEDCLYLDIWAPRSAAENAAQTEEQLPVVVWLNGGDNKLGSSGYFSGHQYAGNQQVVLVSVNFRLGHLGFFSHRATRNTSKTLGEKSGNYGLLDIISALNWVQKNIANFGGDSKNVTIASAGDGSRHVTALIASPFGEGLFQKAIIQGGYMQSISMSEAEHFHDDELPGQRSSSNEIILDLLLLQNVASNREEAKNDIASMSDESLRAFLERQSAESIITANIYHQSRSGHPPSQVAPPIRDGVVIPEASLYKLFSNPINYNNVPMIIGSNRHEAKSAMLFEPDYVTWILNRVPIINDQEFFKITSKLRSDLKFVLAVQEPVKLLSKSRIDVQAAPNIYTYRFDWSNIQSNFLGDWNQLLGASSSQEVDFLFDNFGRKEGLPKWHIKTTRSERKVLSMSIMDYWGSFVHTGSPNRGRSGTLEEWTPWQENSKNTLLLDNSHRGNVRMEEVRYDNESYKNKVTTRLTEIRTLNKCSLVAETLKNSIKLSTIVSGNSQWLVDPSVCLYNHK